MSSPRVLIVSNRLPVRLQRNAGVTVVERSVGGLATGLKPVHDSGESVWIGWPGHDRPVSPAVRAKLDALRCVPVPLSRTERKVFYEHISNAVLWPLVHDRLDRLPLVIDGWDTYELINERFARTVADVWRPGDVIWVHDYHLMRVPVLLRQLLPTATIGFFLHVPFPNPELFLTLPVRQWLVEGMLGADVVGFHTRRYRGHFTAAVRRLLHLEMDADEHLRYDGRAIRLGVFPIGVATRDLELMAARPDVSQRVLQHRTRNARLLLGVDRLDYTKGIPRRLLAFERLLADHPELHGHVQLLQIAVASRQNVRAYRKHRREVEILVASINGRYATPAWTPIQYLNSALGEEELVALYRSTDVMLVTPVRDGMNLVAKEFVAARTDEDGVLLLSEFAGAADELTDAIMVNPYDVAGVAAAMYEALSMLPVERRRRMRGLRRQVREHDVDAWAASFLAAMRQSDAGASLTTPSTTAGDKPHFPR